MFKVFMIAGVLTMVTSYQAYGGNNWKPTLSCGLNIHEVGAKELTGANGIYQNGKLAFIGEAFKEISSVGQAIIIAPNNPVLPGINYKVALDSNKIDMRISDTIRHKNVSILIPRQALQKEFDSVNLDINYDKGELIENPADFGWANDSKVPVDKVNLKCSVVSMPDGESNTY